MGKSDSVTPVLPCLLVMSDLTCCGCEKRGATGVVLCGVRPEAEEAVDHLACNNTVYMK